MKFVSNMTPSFRKKTKIHLSRNRSNLFKKFLVSLKISETSKVSVLKE